MNAREGIKTKRRKLPTFDVAPIKLKTMNAREGIKTKVFIAFWINSF